MDPQQRKLLEVVYEALESSGTCMDSLSGSVTGVYVGNFSVDYQPNQTRDPDYIHRYTSTGSGATIMSNRISHVFNLHGPRYVLQPQSLFRARLFEAQSLTWKLVSRLILPALRQSTPFIKL